MCDSIKTTESKREIIFYHPKNCPIDREFCFCIENGGYIESGKLKMCPKIICVLEPGFKEGQKDYQVDCGICSYETITEKGFTKKTVKERIVEAKSETESKGDDND